MGSKLPMPRACLGFRVLQDFAEDTFKGVENLGGVITQDSRLRSSLY